MNQLEKLKLQLDIKDDTQDVMLELLLGDAIELILAYTNRLELPAQLSTLQRQLAVINYNRLGVEGEQGRSEGGISSTIYVLGDDLPKSIKSQLNQYRLAKLVSYGAT